MATLPINSGHKRAAGSVGDPPMFSMMYNSGHIWKDSGCYLQTKTTGLNIHLVKQGTPSTLLNPLVCQYVPLWHIPRNLRKQVLLPGNWEHVWTPKGKIGCPQWWLSCLHIVHLLCIQMLLGLNYLLNHPRWDFLTPLPFFTLCAEHLDILTLDCSCWLTALKPLYEKVWTDIK